jgi:hypothetical protein
VRILRFSRIGVSVPGAARDAEYFHLQHAEEAAFAWNGIDPLGKQTISVSSAFFNRGLTNNHG